MCSEGHVEINPQPTAYIPPHFRSPLPFPRAAFRLAFLLVLSVIVELVKNSPRISGSVG